jgi:iron complex outermembrane receptor protein
MAQDDSEEDTADVGRVTVTGSRIKRVDIEGPSPVVIITSEDMAQKGFSQVSEVLDSLVQNTGGTADQTFTFGFIPATAAPSLRAFGQNATLVLIDGRRVPIYPIPQSGVFNIVDFANIPTVQVDRIEVLTDGASAIYGSDAIAGVINIITRKDFEGVDLNVRLGDTADGGYQSERVQMFAGTGAGDTRISGSFEYWHNDPIWSRDRDYAASDVANPRGNYSVGGATFVDLFTDNQFLFQAPGCGTPDGPLGGLGIPDQNIPIFTAGDTWCGFNRTAYRMLFAEQTRTSASAYIEHDLGNEVTAFFRAGYTDQTTFTQSEPNFYGGFVFNSTPADDDRVITPLTQPAWGWIPAGQANNYAPEGNPGVFVRRLVEYGPRENDIDMNGVQALAGLKGTFGSRNIYDWDVGIAYNEIDVDITRPNIISSTFNEAVSAGLDLFQPIPQSVIEATRFTASRNAKSSNTTIDGTISGDTGLELAGGPLAFAVHADYTDEDFSNVPDSISQIGDAFDGGSAGSGERKHYGLGVEAAIPVLPTVNVTAALRYDDYDDESTTGDATSPKIGIEWRPIRDLLVRGGWGESFRAPDLQRLFGATTNAFASSVIDPVTGLEVQSVAIRSGSNPIHGEPRLGQHRARTDRDDPERAVDPESLWPEPGRPDLRTGDA